MESHLLGGLFCFGQTLLYLYVFFDGIKRWVGLGVSVLAIAGILLFSSPDTSVSMPLPDDVSFSDTAVVALADDSYGEAKILNPEDGYVNIHMKKYGSTVMTITDGDKIYQYDIELKMIDNINQIEVIPKNHS